MKTTRRTLHTLRQLMVALLLAGGSLAWSAPASAESGAHRTPPPPPDHQPLPADGSRA